MNGRRLGWGLVLAIVVIVSMLVWRNWDWLQVKADSVFTPTPEVIHTLRAGEVQAVQFDQTHVSLNITSAELVGDYLYSRAMIGDEPAWVILNVVTKELYNSKDHLASVNIVNDLPRRFSLRKQDESIGEPDTILAYDWKTGQEKEISNGQKVYDYFISGNIAIWTRKQGEKWGIYGYDLEKDVPLTFIADTGERGYVAYPKLSGHWIAYTDYISEFAYDLYVTHIETGETLRLGRVSRSEMDGSVRYYDIDNERVLWVEWVEGWQQVHLYDLNTRQERILNQEADNCAVREVILAGDLAIWPCGKVWQGLEVIHEITFELPYFPFDEDIYAQFSQPLVSETRIAWFVGEWTFPVDLSKESTLYTMPILRE
jgi:hypothetical protein